MATELNSDQKKKRDTIARMVGNMYPSYFKRHVEGLLGEWPPMDYCITDAFDLYDKVEQAVITEASKGVE